MKSKTKTSILSFVIAVIATFSAGFAFLVHNSNEQFSLEPELYQGAELKEITATEFNDLIDNRKSFVVIAHMDFCPAETPLTTTAQTLVHDDGYTFYGLKTEDFSQTILADTIQYLPSAVIIHEGELVAYLDAESDEDIPYYQSADQLREWLGKYIELEPNN